ncbi:hypothetical protein AB0K16_22375 [Nonomuraea jabiensis]|uniref:hypothetical protein n=1 Tax=Nonomuraea jabiensis TaxID=882448 RepID=UPI003431BDF7
MSRFEDREALAGKIEWEGGMEMALDYGIDSQDLPEGDTELETVWIPMEEAWVAFREAADVVENLLGLG